MKTLIIPRRKPGTGSIFSVASEHYDRRIKFRRRCLYAVVLPAHCGEEYTTHKLARTAIKEYACAGFGAIILGDDGYQYAPSEKNQLTRVGDPLAEELS